LRDGGRIIRPLPVLPVPIRAHLSRLAKPRLVNTRRRGKIYPGTFPGCYTIVGTPDDVAGEMTEMSEAGLAGASICFLNYLEAMPYFIQEALPRLERAGLRESSDVSRRRAAVA
jgi:alkanesulfonate monooxygenase SsuD/methylene tetrahydromethanopterin reductase-like flavin-dependent oxidoreductase (luciferase family)